MHTYVVRIWLPDRPGALGLVASRIGAVGGDVVAIEVLERGGGTAVDDLTVQLPDRALVELLVAEVRQVDGAAVEHLHEVDPARLEPGLMALSLGAEVLAVPTDRRPRLLADAAQRLLDADWAVVLRAADLTHLAVVGSAPDLEWVRAFVQGSRHLPGGDDVQPGEGMPGDLAATSMPVLGLDVLCGREGRVLHTRERLLLAGLARLVDAASADSSDRRPAA